MKISEAVSVLQQINAEFGDLTIVGGDLYDDYPPTSICVVNSEGAEIWPTDVNDVRAQSRVEGVFIS